MTAIVGAYHEVEVDVINTERFQGRLNALLDALVPRVVQLGCDPDLFTRHARILNALANLGLVSVRERSIDVTIALLKSDFDGIANLIGL